MIENIETPEKQAMDADQPVSQPFHLPVELSLDQCIKCNICITACPVAAVTDLFPGPKYEAPQGGRFRMPGQPTPDHSVDYCSGCRACNLACPTGVKIAEMNARARHTLVEQGKVPARLRLRNNLIARTELLGGLAQPIAPLSNAVLANPLARKAAEVTLGIAAKAYFPPFARERFTAWFKKTSKARAQRAAHSNEADCPAASPQKQVAFFHGCATEYYEPRLGRAAIFVLEALGFEVIVPRQNCCGLPLLSNGEFDAARQAHQRNVKSLVEFARQGIPIVGTSTSCTLTLKEEAPELLDMHDEATRLVAENTYDFNEFLLLQPTFYELPCAPIPLTLPYHQPCQYRGHRLGNPAVGVLARIPALTILESHATCCGIAGTYGYKKEKYEIAQAVGEPLFEFIKSVGAPLAVCDSETCRWQITHGTGLPAVHPVELLAASLGSPTEGVLAKVLRLRHTRQEA
jgi:glycerol-3-phosphate dehydrogenase subunit C